jgi:Mn-containing catalase
MLSFLIARDTMHQNQLIAAIAELEAREGRVVPNTFPRELEKQAVSYTYPHQIYVRKYTGEK